MIPLLTAVAALLIGAGAAPSLAPAVVGISAGYGLLQLVLIVVGAGELRLVGLRGARHSLAAAPLSVAGLVPRWLPASQSS